jgi:hypothetical protein
MPKAGCAGVARILAVATFALAATFQPASASSTSWQAAIEAVQDKADRYRAYAVEAGGTSWAGSMYNGYMATEHRCAILGRMLGHADDVGHIEKFDHPPMDARSEPHDLLVFSISLENWVAAARWATQATQDQRAKTWNLDCVGKFGIARNLHVESGAPDAEFKVEGGQLHVYGDIDRGFAARFIAMLDAHPEVQEVTLGSAGGSVRDALVAGAAIRSRGLGTTIYGNCYSACPLVFLGGVRRVVWAAPYRLGFHQIYTDEGPVPFGAEVYRRVADYTWAMGADPEAVLRWMRSAPPSGMHEPEPEALCGAEVATFVQRICGADMQR